jgi:hypothetical protein
MMFRDGVIEMGLGDWVRVDWDDKDEIWHEFVLACGKVQIPLATNAFEFATQECRRLGIKSEIDETLTKGLTRPKVDQLEHLVSVAYLLQQWQGDRDIFLPVELVGLHIAEKSDSLGKSAGSRLVEALRNFGILVCTNPIYSQARKLAKGHRLNPERKGLYVIK